MNKIRIVGPIEYRPFSLKEGTGGAFLGAIKAFNQEGFYVEKNDEAAARVYTANENRESLLSVIRLSLLKYLSQKDPEAVLNDIAEEGIVPSKVHLMGSRETVWVSFSHLAAFANFLTSKPSMEDGKNAFDFGVYVPERLPSGLGTIYDGFRDDRIKCRVAYFNTLDKSSSESIQKAIAALLPYETLFCIAFENSVQGAFVTRNNQGKIVCVCTTQDLYNRELNCALEALNVKKVLSGCLPMEWSKDTTVHMEIVIYFLMEAAKTRNCFVGEILGMLHDKTTSIHSINTIKLPDWVLKKVGDRVTAFRFLLILKNSLERAVESVYSQEKDKKDYWITALNKVLPLPAWLFKKPVIRNNVDLFLERIGHFLDPNEDPDEFRKNHRFADSPGIEFQSPTNLSDKEPFRRTFSFHQQSSFSESISKKTVQERFSKAPMPKGNNHQILNTLADLCKSFLSSINQYGSWEPSDVGILMAINQVLSAKEKGTWITARSKAVLEPLLPGWDLSTIVE